MTRTRRSRGPAWHIALAVLVALSACTSAPTGTSSAPSSNRPLPETTPPPPTESSPSSEPATSAGARATQTAPPEGCDGPDVVEVDEDRQLSTALNEARPGSIIRLAAGVYEGNFVATTEATEQEPIRLCGTREAVLDGGDVDNGYTLHLRGADHWQLAGFTVTGGEKGVMVDAGVGNRIEGLLVTSVGDEAIHLRTHSSDNVVIGNTVRETGLRKAKYGEGIYVGSAESNWCRQSNCKPDRSDRNVIQGNDIAGTTAEAVDIKEGTANGVLRGNRFDGSDMVEADSWVDVKGNGWTIEDNRGTNSSEDGFQVHEVVDGWGRGAMFSGNSASDVAGLAINAAGPRVLRNSTTVLCDNVVTGGAARSNVECSSG